MSELKTYKMVDEEYCADCFCVIPSEVYLKSEADEVIEEKDAEIAKLKEERRWRSVSEEMPKDGAEVLASDGVGIWLCYKTTLSDGSPWFQPDGLPHIEGVTHWMPLPNAPKEEK